MTDTKKPAEKAHTKGDDDRIERLERELAAMKEVMRRNGWSLED